MVVSEPRLKVKSGSSPTLVGVGPDGLLLRGEYSPKEILSGELDLKKNLKKKITLELSEKFISVWTRNQNGSKDSVYGTRVFIFKRSDQAIWYGEGTPNEVRVDGKNYPKTDKEYERISEELERDLGDLFFIYPDSEKILQAIDDVSGRQPDSVNRFLKLLCEFLD